MSKLNSNSRFITFYSFKGGVGRSMALINTAVNLTYRGFRVLIIDLDLEAPGLSFLDLAAGRITRETEDTSTNSDAQLGFVDLMLDVLQRGKHADLFTLLPVEFAHKYSRSYPIPVEFGASPGGSLNIMPAGRLDSTYTSKFNTLDLHGLYEDGVGEPAIRTFKKRVAESGFDYIFVDSRTGFSDEAGICTRDLADYLIILSGLNSQNIEGTSEFLRSLRRLKEQDPIDNEKKFQIVLSPIPNGEDALVDEKEKIAFAAFSAAYGRDIDLQLRIPYHPQLSLRDEPYIFARRRGYLFDAYRNLETHLLQGLGHDASSLSSSLQEEVKKREYESALHIAERIVKLDGGVRQITEFAGFLARDEDGQGASVALKHVFGEQLLDFLIDNVYPSLKYLGNRILLLDLRRSAPKIADRFLSRLLEQNPNDSDLMQVYSIHLAHELGNLEKAEALSRASLELDKDNLAKIGNYGQILLALGRFAEGEATLRKCIVPMIRKPADADVLAETLLALWFALRLQDKPGESVERMFKYQVVLGFRRSRWSFKPILDTAQEYLGSTEWLYAKALVEAFLDEAAISVLEKELRWTSLDPLEPRVGSL